MKYTIREMMKELTGLTDLQWGGYAFYHEPLERKFTPEQKENYTRLANKCGEEEAESLLSEYPEDLMKKMMETGVTVHLNLAKVSNTRGKKQFVEQIGTYTVLTTTMNYATARQLFFKRAMDIAGGLVGCILTGLITLFVGPAIYIKSPSPLSLEYNTPFLILSRVSL